MTTPVVTVEPWMSAYAAAWSMSVHDVNRLPVVESGALVGIVARADLVRHFARADEAIAREVRAELDALDVTDVGVRVESGVATLSGEIDAYEFERSIRRAVLHVPGVVSVERVAAVNGPAERVL